jgi:hypothetical protein
MIKAKKFLWPQTGSLTFVFLMSLPSVFYHFYLVQNNPVVGQRALQNITLISPPIFVLIGYGFLWFGFIFGLVYMFKIRFFEKKFIFLLCWLAVNLGLIFSPFPFQSRYSQGIHVVLVIFTVVGIFYIFDFLKNHSSNKFFNFWVNNNFLLGVLFAVFFLPSVFFVLMRDVYYFTAKPIEIINLFYLPNDFMSAMRWLKDQPSSIVLADGSISAKFIPAFGLQRTYLSHLHETLFAESKSMYTSWFFSDDNNIDAKRDFLLKENISYLLYTDYEKKLGSFDPSTKSYFKLVFDLPKAKIYQVVKNQ